MQELIISKENGGSKLLITGRREKEGGSCYIFKITSVLQKGQNTQESKVTKAKEFLSLEEETAYLTLLKQGQNADDMAMVCAGSQKIQRLKEVQNLV